MERKTKIKEVNLNNIIQNKRRIGSILQNLREIAELSQRDVAGPLGYSNVNFISIVESGRSSPPMGKLNAITKEYKTDPILTAVIVKYLYPDTWHTVVEMIRNNYGVFTDLENINQVIEEKFIEMIKEYSLVA